MKVRGKLMPGQPTAKEHADKIRREQAINLPQDYGENTAFVHNSTAKPITAYKTPLRASETTPISWKGCMID